MKRKINDDGVVVDDDGKPVLIDDEPIELPGLQTEEQVKKVVQGRLARQSAQIKELEKIAERSPAFQATIDELKEDLQTSKDALADADANASKQVKSQLDEANQKAAAAEESLAAERVGRMHDNVATQVLGLGGDFVNPAADLVPKMLGAHSQEPVLGDDGKPTGDLVHRFELSFPDPEKDGATKTEKLPLNDAVEVMKGLFPHYVKGKASGGSGGSKFLKGPRAITSHDQLTTDAERAAFVSEHGLPALQALSKKPAG